MLDHAAYRPHEAQAADDPSSPGSILGLFGDGLGQDGAPFVVRVSDPPNHTRPAHSHHADVLYLYVAGEHRIDGEGTYRPGDVRWVRAGHSYGPETTGPEGGSWWVISNADPTPLNTTPDPVQPSTAVHLQRFSPPVDWDQVDRAVLSDGAVLVKGLIEAPLVDRLNADLDSWLSARPGAGLPDTGSQLYDDFLGRRTVRLHGLSTKLASGPDLIGHPAIVAWAERMLAPSSASILLNAGELIQIGGDEPAQFPHRDSDSWPLPAREHPVVVNAIVALSEFNEDNGATALALGSHRWAPGRYPTPSEVTQTRMEPGDVLLFRGDIIHHGGANTTARARRGVSVSYCCGWLRPVENSSLNAPPNVARDLEAKIQDLLGYASHDATATAGGILGLYESGDPHEALVP